MKKILLLFLLLFGVVTMLPAQKNSASKTTNKQITPPLVKPRVRVIAPVPPPPPPPKSSSSTISIGSGELYPMISESPSKTKFDKEKICTTCDTLVLEPGKAHIVIYDVVSLANSNENKYFDQPTEKDLKKSPYGMRGTTKREWDELRKNYPEGDFVHHHVYRSTFIKVPNIAHESISLLNRQERHQGFVYWNGNAKDKISESKNMVQLTERVAKQRGEAKVSSYVSAFKKDSLTVQNLLRTQNPDKNLQANMNLLLQDKALSDELLPFAFLDLKKISSITVASESEAADKTYAYQFNTAGQLTAINSRDENSAIAYKDDLPFTLSKEGKAVLHFYYQNDLVIIKEAHQVTTKKLVGNVFMETSRFETEAKDYKAMDLKGDIQSELLSQKGESCVRSARVSSEDNWSQCYSNIQWKLPLTVTYNYNGDVRTRTYSKNESGELLIESANSYKTRRLVYKLQDGTATQISSTQKKGDGDFGNPYILNVKTTYFK